MLQGAVEVLSWTFRMMTVRSIKMNAGEVFSRLIRVYFRESNSKSERMVPYADNIFQFAELILQDTSSRDEGPKLDLPWLEISPIR